MVQNRNKLIELFISNISNAIVHKILEKATKQEELSSKYNKEQLSSFTIAKKYREKINPKETPLPFRDISYVKEKIISKVKTELLLRISKGYKNINLELVEEFVDEFLKEMRVI